MRTEITNALNNRKEATAKQIAEDTGLELKDVINEINAMHRDGEVEREKRKGNEYTYWLSNPAVAAADSATEEKVPVFNFEAVKETIDEVIQETASANETHTDTDQIQIAEDVVAEPQLPAETFATVLVEKAIQILAEQLPKDVSLGIFSDGTIDVLDSATDTTYLCKPSELRDLLGCFHTLNSYKQAA